jgi:hypothetical protein
MPILQMIAREYVLRFTFIQLFTWTQRRVCRFYTSFGPSMSTARMLPSYFLFGGWPLAISIVSCTYGGQIPGFPSTFGSYAHLSQSGLFMHFTSADSA